MKKLSSTLPNMLLSLTGICLIVAAALGFMNQVTAKPIAKAEIDAKVAAIKAVVPEFDNNPFEEQFKVAVPNETDSLVVFPAKKAGEIVGYAIETYTKNGFSGLITIMIGFDNDSKIHDFSVLQHAETPGLGSKMQEFFHAPAKNEGSIQDMRGVSMGAEPLKVSKDGGKVDAITAATISSRAFLDAVNRAYSAYQVAKGVAVEGVTGASQSAEDESTKVEQEATY